MRPIDWVWFLLHFGVTRSFRQLGKLLSIVVGGAAVVNPLSAAVGVSP